MRDKPYGFILRGPYPASLSIQLEIKKAVREWFSLVAFLDPRATRGISNERVRIRTEDFDIHLHFDRKLCCWLIDWSLSGVQASAIDYIAPSYDL